MRFCNTVQKITIEWAKDATLINVSKEKFCKIVKGLAELNSSGYVFCENKFNTRMYPDHPTVGVTNARAWHANKVNWTIDENGQEYALYIATPKGLYRAYTPQFKEKNALGGYKGIQRVSREINKAFGEKIYLFAGSINGIRHPEVMMFFKNCQYRPMIYTAPWAVGKVITNFHKIDRSSAYPASGATFPKFSTLQKFENPEAFFYSDKKFGFFEDSGRVVEKGVFDSAEILKNPWYGGLYPDTVKAHSAPDGTCWAFDETADISDVWAKLYDERKHNTNIKGAMVSAIGFMQSTKYAKKTFFGHCSAVIYLRHIKNMLKKIAEIENAGGRIINIATDSIGWTGGDLSKIEVDRDKHIGSYHLECTNSLACFKCNGVYAFQTKEGITCKHQGVTGEVEINNILEVLNLTPTVKVFKIEEINGLAVPQIEVREMTDGELWAIDSEGD